MILGQVLWTEAASELIPMYAFVTFFVAGLACWAHYEFIGRVVIPGSPLTVWRVWYLAVLIAALVDALKAKDAELRAVWAIMAMSYFASFMTWDLSARPLEDNAIRMIAVSAAALIVCSRYETGLLVLLHGLVLFAAYLASIGAIPSAGQRPKAFLAWSFPDISAGLQYACLIIIGGLGAAQNAVLGWRNRGRSMAASAGVPVLQTKAGE